MSHAGHTVPAPAGFVPHTVAHHFESQEQEYQSAKLGFWLFLVTEILLFGGLFVAYFYYHTVHHDAFSIGGKQLSWKLGTTNTAVLLFSSFTMAMGVRSAQLSQKKAMLTYLVLTFLCACGFLVVKYFEYSAKIDHGLGAGSMFHPHDPQLLGYEGLSMFFALYWTMTGIHGFHVLCGMVVIAWLIWRGAKGELHAKHYMPVDIVGLYWHLVDLIWIFLFPLLYLVP
ncbi:MAG: cytochrome c oxidase subunit 3 family protein [Planctomycetes bacterium]|nr:cytochrome c oxidase subunit 3 family protein [Planctomycetota bacterium]MCB9888141.1 cytochrome c oxidase subunit 3 family protein [Planctomycetota bacterium]